MNLPHLAELAQALRDSYKHTKGGMLPIHALLYGPPACGKRAVLQALAQEIGESEVVWVAGEHASKLPEVGAGKVLIVEELEKVSDYVAILGLMSRRADVLVWGTTNDVVALKAIAGGALLNKFVMYLRCPGSN